MRTEVSVNDVGLAVEIVGEGRPLVLLHGWSMSGAFFRKQVDELSAKYQLVIPDLRGHGGSEKSAHGHTVPNHASDIHALVSELRLEQPVLLGWSMGAMVVYNYLQLFGSSDVAAIVVVDQGPSDFAWPDYEYGAFEPSELLDAVEAMQMDQEGFVRGFVPLMLHAPDDESVSWMTDQILQVPPLIACAMLTDQTLRDYRPMLEGIDVPTLLMFGRDDKLTDPAGGEYTADRIKGSQLTMFEHTSHMPFWEEPQKFNAALSAFVDAL
jgi:pimeloyl-ACP methyl ester carboxylesterase